MYYSDWTFSKKTYFSCLRAENTESVLDSTTYWQTLTNTSVYCFQGDESPQPVSLANTSSYRTLSLAHTYCQISLTTADSVMWWRPITAEVIFFPFNLQYESLSHMLIWGHRSEVGTTMCLTDTRLQG